MNSKFFDGVTKKVETIIIHQIPIEQQYLMMTPGPCFLRFSFCMVDKKPLIELESQLWEPKTKDSEGGAGNTKVIKDILFPPFFDTCVKHHLTHILHKKPKQRQLWQETVLCIIF